MNKAIKELYDCVEYCKKQNGVRECKNCGLNNDIIHNALTQSMKGQHVHLVNIIKSMNVNDMSEYLKKKGWNELAKLIKAV